MYDLTVIRPGEKIAVHCPTEIEAREFLAQLKNYNPDACRFWGPGETNWHMYEWKTAYTFFNSAGEGCLLTYSDIDYFEREGYEVIPVYRLSILADLGELNTDGVSICDFLEMR